jgi:hypothetical protein
VQDNDTRILFDYADILCYNNEGELNETSWTDGTGVSHSYQHIHPDNMLDLDGSYVEDGDHIGEVGTVRLGKALWWMLARMAGWNGIDNSTSTTTTATGSTTTTTGASTSTTSVAVSATTSTVFASTTSVPATACIDTDHDSYGENCPAGPDSDDSDPFLHEAPSCSVTIVPRALGWFLGDTTKTRFAVAVGARGAQFDDDTDVRWETGAISTVKTWAFMKRIMLIKMSIDGATLGKGEYRVLIGGCLGAVALVR